MSNQDEMRRQITDLILATLQRGDRLPPWRRPWCSDDNAGSPRNAMTRREYRGINVIILEASVARNGYRSRYWATFNQIHQSGGHVRRGERATRIVLFKPVTARRTDEGDEAGETFHVMRSFPVFNVEQADGLERLRVGEAPVPANEVQRRYEHADAVIGATGADIRCGDRAYYDRIGDYIVIPPRDRFVLPEFYETVFHELTHWTEHRERLNGDRSRAEHTYALGELVAELGGVYMAGQIGLPVSGNLDNHAAYVKSWLQALQNDTRFIFRAAAQASKAVDFLLAFSGTGEPVSDPEAVLTA